MKQSTIETIETIIKADAEVTPEQIRNVLTACKSPTIRRKMIHAKSAMEILDVSRPTLRKLVREKKLQAINLTPRKTRFYLDEVERLKYVGGN